MDDLSPLSSALSSPTSSPMARRKKSLKAAVEAVRKGSLSRKSSSPTGSMSQEVIPIDSPSSSRKSLEVDTRVKDIIEEIVHTSPQYHKRDFSFSTNRNFIPSSSSSSSSLKVKRQPVDVLLLNGVEFSAVKQFEKSDRYERAMQAGSYDPLRVQDGNFNGEISRANSRAGSRPNSRGILLSRSKSRGGSRGGGRSRPGTINEVFEGDVFQSLDDIGETDVNIPFVRVARVNSSVRTAQGENGETYSFQNLLNPRKYRRVINSKPKTPHRSSDVGSAAVWFEDPVNPQLFANEVPENPQLTDRMLPSQSAIIAGNKHEAREGFFETLRRYRHDDDRLDTDARRAFIHACRDKNLNPLPIVISLLQTQGPLLDLSNRMLGSDYVDCLSVVLKCSPFIESIDISGNKLDGKSADKLINNLFHSNVHNIVLDKNKWGKNIVKNISQLLVKQAQEPEDRISSFPECVTILSLNDTSLGDLGGSQLCNSLHKLVNITTLLLRENQLTEQFVYNISSFLKALNCPLLNLDLSWNNLRTEGAIELMKAISRKASLLEVLKLDWNGVNDEFLPFLHKFLKLSPNTALKKLSICNNMLSTQRLGMMVNLRPDLEIAYSEIVFTSSFVIGR